MITLRADDGIGDCYESHCVSSVKRSVPKRMPYCKSFFHALNKFLSPTVSFIKHRLLIVNLNDDQ